MDDATHRALRRDVVIVDALAAVFDVLRSEPLTPRTRELLAQAKTYERAVKHWATVPPTNAQFEAMLELVTDLHAKVAGSGARGRGTGGASAP